MHSEHSQKTLYSPQCVWLETVDILCSRANSISSDCCHAKSNSAPSFYNMRFFSYTLAHYQSAKLLGIKLKADIFKRFNYKCARFLSTILVELLHARSDIKISTKQDYTKFQCSKIETIITELSMTLKIVFLRQTHPIFHPKIPKSKCEHFIRFSFNKKQLNRAEAGVGGGGISWRNRCVAICDQAEFELRQSFHFSRRQEDVKRCTLSARAGRSAEFGVNLRTRVDF